jgi:uncharacterized repeat protein (TIGR01451 family)
MKLSVMLVLALGLAGLWGTASAQDNPIRVDIEAYIVSQVTADDGSVTERFTESTTARPGQVVEYRVAATNTDETTLPAESVSVLGPIPDAATYVDGSATPTSERVRTEFSLDGETFAAAPETTEGPSAYAAVRWTLLVPLEPGQEERFVYRVTIN